ncbi:histidine phosphatase family protein [Streptomyces sp. NPDC055722]
MTIRLTLLCARTTDDSVDAVFGHGAQGDDDLHEAGTARSALPPYSPALRSPSTRCAMTAAALGLQTVVEPALRDLDYGTWRGRTVDEVVAEDPFGYSAWLTDPDAAPHGGESVRRLCRRTGAWLRGLPSDTGRVVAIAEPAVFRALLVHALSAPARALWGLQIPPMYAVSLVGRGDDWRIRSVDGTTPHGIGRSAPFRTTVPAALWQTNGRRTGQPYGERARVFCGADADGKGTAA